jgi:hypothetical protein
MTDRVYLSLWLRGHTQFNMLQSLERALERFPVSHADRAAALRIYALELVEPPMAEQQFEEADVTEIMSLAREFENPDCAYEVELRWDLWQREETWQLTPTPVRITCFAPKFPSDLGEQLLIDLGFEYLYLPNEEARPNWMALRSNIRSLLRFASDLEEVLPIGKRTLWSDSGEDFADRIEEAMASA